MLVNIPYMLAFFFSGEELAPTREDDVSSAQGAPNFGAEKSLCKFFGHVNFGGST